MRYHLLSAVLMCLTAWLSGCSSTVIRVNDSDLTVKEAESLIARLDDTSTQRLQVIRQMKPEAFEAVGLYRINPGDTGAKIAAAHGLTIADLQALNPRVDWTKLHVWQVVRIKPAADE